MARLCILFFLVFCCVPGLSIAEETVMPEKQKESLKTTNPDEKGDFVYDSGGRRDPFIPLIDLSRGKRAGKKKSPLVLGTLESYDVPDFEVIAIIEKGKKGFYALLLAPDNKSFVVTEGVVIGLNGGKITDIKRDKIIVVEEIEDFKGDILPRQVTLELYEGGVE
jgi:Tfp pilus assembly protein PilP